MKHEGPYLLIHAYSYGKFENDFETIKKAEEFMAMHYGQGGRLLDDSGYLVRKWVRNRTQGKHYRMVRL